MHKADTLKDLMPPAPASGSAFSAWRQARQPHDYHHLLFLVLKSASPASVCSTRYTLNTITKLQTWNCISESTLFLLFGTSVPTKRPSKDLWTPTLYSNEKMKLVLKYLTSISITSEINLHIYQFSTSEKQFSSEMLNVQVIPVQNSQG